MNVENLPTHADSNLIVITVGLYKFFLAHGRAGKDAKDVYEHLIFTARIQKTNQVWAAESYLAKGCGMGVVRIRRAKAFLHRHGIIDYVRTIPTKENPHLGKVYIRLVYLHRQETLVNILAEQKSQDSTDMVFISVEPTDMISTDMVSTDMEIHPKMLKTNNTKCLKPENPNALNEEEKDSSSTSREEENSRREEDLKIFLEKINALVAQTGEYEERLGWNKRTKALVESLLAEGVSLDWIAEVVDTYRGEKTGRLIVALESREGWEQFRQSCAIRDAPPTPKALRVEEDFDIVVERRAGESWLLNPGGIDVGCIYILGGTPYCAACREMLPSGDDVTRCPVCNAELNRGTKECDVAARIDHETFNAIHGQARRVRRKLKDAQLQGLVGEEDYSSCEEGK